MNRHLSFANVVAVLALFFALGGSVYAASSKISGTQIKAKSIPANRIKSRSLTAAQIKSKSITAAQIKSGTITGHQIQAGSISGPQIKAGSITGAQIDGATLQGVVASSLSAVQYATATGPIGLGEAATKITANCPSGTKVIGGGAGVTNPTFALVNETAPTPERTGWYASAFAGEPGMTLTVTAICTAVITTTG